MEKYKVPYRLQAPMGGVRLTGGRYKKVFDNNVRFLKDFDVDRILYWYRVHKGVDAPGVPYAGDAGHFENNLKGQTAGEFLMGAGTTLLWEEDETLRRMVREVLAGMEACRDDDGFIIPIPREQFATREYPNYTRAWITFGLLDAGYAGETRAFALARDMTDVFNKSEILPYVKDLNLGFQGILANTRMYDAPTGTAEDIRVAIEYYQETWWLEQVIRGDHRAIYEHPGNHPHSTLLTTLEGYLDLYRATGDTLYLDAVKTRWACMRLSGSTLEAALTCANLIPIGLVATGCPRLIITMSCAPPTSGCCLTSVCIGWSQTTRTMWTR